MRAVFTSLAEDRGQQLCQVFSAALHRERSRHPTDLSDYTKAHVAPPADCRVCRVHRPNRSWCRCATPLRGMTGYADHTRCNDSRRSSRKLGHGSSSVSSKRFSPALRHVHRPCHALNQGRLHTRSLLHQCVVPMVVAIIAAIVGQQWIQAPFSTQHPGVFRGHHTWSLCRLAEVLPGGATEIAVSVRCRSRSPGPQKGIQCVLAK